MAIDWIPLRELINRSQRFVLSSHVRPDADAIGSEIGLAGLLRQWGKEVRIINPSATPEHLMFLDPERTIRAIGGDVTVESVRDTDVHIVLDTSAWQQLPIVADALKTSPAVKVVIDHHVSSDQLGAVEFKDVTASATGLLVTEFIECCGGSLTSEMSRALFAAIATDTGWFRFPNADARTLQAASRLIAAGAQPHQIYRELYERSSLAKLKLHARVLDRVRLDCEGRLAHTWVSRNDFVETGAQPADTEDLVNVCLTIEGVQAAFILVEQTDGRIKASLRSRSTLDVAAIAELTGGGGHRQAAGTMLPGPIPEAQNSLLHAFENQMPSAL